MRQHSTYIILLTWSLFSIIKSFGQNNNNDVLFLFADTLDPEVVGYKNLKGDTIIPLGKYPICYTDTFKTYAIVLKPYQGFVAIDRKENILFEVFPFDNGPDYTADGLFRIIKDNKIGYADSLTGHIVIEPQFDCAFPFVKGIAKVSKDCRKEKSGEEHTVWLSNNWYYIDKKGVTVNRPKTETGN